LIKSDNHRLSPRSQPFFVGTYTDGTSKGIYKYLLGESGKLTESGLVAKTENPSFLAMSADGGFLVAINEIDLKGAGGRVESYSVDSDRLTRISQKQSGGAHPCFVSINNDNFILTANYSSGTIGLLKLLPDGSLSDILDIQEHSGRDITDRQRSPHAHSVSFVPGSNDIIALDLGIDQIRFSRLDPVRKKLLPLSPDGLHMTPGSGPRHFVFHPGGRWLYLTNELNSSVSHIQRNETGNYSALALYSSLPANFQKPNTCSDLKISSDGNFLYVANRGHDSIAVFRVNPENGSLKLLGHKSCGGKNPRGITLSPDESFLLVANQSSGSLVVLSRNKTSGLLKYNCQVGVTAPSCILF